MTQQQQLTVALAQLVRAYNIVLAIQNAPYRVTEGDIITARRNGYTLLALPETSDTRGAADFRAYARPYSTMDNHS